MKLDLACREGFAALPRVVRCTAYDYLDGRDVRAELPASTWRRHRRLLLPFGVDIARTVHPEPRVYGTQRKVCWFPVGTPVLAEHLRLAQSCRIFGLTGGEA